MLRQRDEGALLGYLSSQRKYLPNGDIRMFPMGLTRRGVCEEAGRRAGGYVPSPYLAVHLFAALPTQYHLYGLPY